MAGCYRAEGDAGRGTPDIERRKEKRMKYSPATERRMKLVKAGKVTGGIAFAALYGMLYNMIWLPQINRGQQ